MIRDIGSGNFGVAKLVRDVAKRELYAVKFIERGQKVCFCLLFFSLKILFLDSSNFTAFIDAELFLDLFFRVVYMRGIFFLKKK